MGLFVQGFGNGAGDFQVIKHGVLPAPTDGSMMKFNTLGDIDLKGKRVFIRADLNVPVKDGAVTSDARITASVPTILHCLKAGAKVMVTSHLGRPEEGVFSAENSLAPVAAVLEAQLGQPVRLLRDWVDGGFDVAAGEVVLLENCRFNVGEKKNLEATAKKYAALCDVFVMDAFGTAHRAEASTYGVAQFAPQACAGLLVAQELDALQKALAHPARPMVAIVGGSKVSTKLTVLEALADKVDQLVVGGGIANTFLLATGNNVGESLCEADLISTAQRLMKKMTARGANIPIAVDVVCGKKFDAAEPAVRKPANAVLYDDKIWNGPVGVFEFDQFADGTKKIAEAIAATKAFTLAGGGDTIAAIQKYDIYEKVSYISTAGGAFLEFLEGKKLPAIEMLERRCNALT